MPASANLPHQQRRSAIGRALSDRPKFKHEAALPRQRGANAPHRLELRSEGSAKLTPPKSEHLSFLPGDARDKSEPILFRTPEGVRASGYRAELLLRQADAANLPVQ